MDELRLRDVEAVQAVEVDGNEVPPQLRQVTTAVTVDVAAGAEEALTNFRGTGEGAQLGLLAQQLESGRLHQASHRAELRTQRAVAARALGPVQLHLELHVAAKTGTVVLLR